MRCFATQLRASSGAGSAILTSVPEDAWGKPWGGPLPVLGTGVGPVWGQGHGAPQRLRCEVPHGLIPPGGGCVDVVLLENGGNWDGRKGLVWYEGLACPIALQLSALASLNE